VGIEFSFSVVIHKAGFTKSSAHTGAVTLIQRFGSALNLNIHFHMLYLDGVYAEDAYGKVRFHRIKAPTADELAVLVHRISQRVAKFLERRGFLESDEENGYLTLETSDDEAMQQLYGHSITYRIAIGPQQGRKVFTLQSLPPIEEPKAESSRVAKVAGFSLHAGVAAEAHQRDKLERLCRYIARPAVSGKRLSLLDDGRIRYELKTPYRDGTTHVTAPAHPALAALVHPCTSSSSRLTFWLGLLRWFPNRASTSPASTVYLRLTANTGYRSHPPNAAKAASATLKRKGHAHHLQSAAQP
jgi:hypothetical protein